MHAETCSFADTNNLILYLLLLLGDDCVGADGKWRSRTAPTVP